jgi:hypothetical protein
VIRHVSHEALLLSGGLRPCGRSAAWTIVLTIAAIAVVRPFGIAGQFPKDEHGKQSFNLALNLSLCHQAAVESSVFAPARYLTEHPDALELPAPALLSKGAGSVSAYCATLTQPVAHTENTMMLLTSLVWLMNPNQSARGVERAFQVTRVLAAALFAFACLDAGASVLISFTAMCGALAVSKSMALYEFSLYSFLLSVPLTWAAACVVMFRPARAASILRLTILSIVMGLLAAVLINVRTSYAPILVALYATTIAACVRYRSRENLPSDRAPFVAAAIAGFGVGLVAMNAAIVRPLMPHAGVSATYMHHPLTHNLVLGLAVPANPLSIEEGIAWRDDVGEILARRVAPDVSFLGPGYDAALARYYVGLWRTRPREMIATYWTKLLRTGRGVFLFASDLLPDWGPLRKIYLVWADRTNGLEILLVSMGVTLLSLWALWRTTSPLALLASLLGTALTMIVIESAIIYSEFVLAYHSFMMFMVLVSPAIVLQGALDAAAAWRRSRGATTARLDIGERA